MPLILLVDDGEDDRLLTQLAIRALGRDVRIEEAADGEEALAFLQRTPTPPALVLLDLKMPRMGGEGVLHARLEDEALRVIPVAVYSTSRNPADVRRSYALGANVYLNKPHHMSDQRALLDDVLGVFLDRAETVDAAAVSV